MLFRAGVVLLNLIESVFVLAFVVAVIGLSVAITYSIVRQLSG